MKPIFQRLHTILQIGVDVAAERSKCVVVKVLWKGENIFWGSAWNETNILISHLETLQTNVAVMGEGTELLQQSDR